MRLYLDVAASRFRADPKTREEPRTIRIAWGRDDAPDPVCRLIRPNTSLTIDPATLSYHGLTVERLERDGVDPAAVIAELENAITGNGVPGQHVRSIVSFHSDFHWRGLHRLMGVVGAPVPTTAVCAMKLAEPICNLPASYRPGTKSPSLREACERLGIPLPVRDGDPIEIAFSTLLAVRAVYEACVKEHDQR